jgi:hypothetical protein
MGLASKAAYSDQTPELFAAIVAEDYVDYGHNHPDGGRRVPATTMTARRRRSE